MTRISLVLLVMGFITLLVGFGYGGVMVGAPYIDPTPQQRWEEVRQDAVAETIALVGIADFALGLFVGGAGIALKIKRRLLWRSPVTT